MSIAHHLQQLGIHCYYTGDVKTGLSACERLLRMPLSEHEENQARSNRTWYTPRLHDLLDCRLTPLFVSPAQEHWTLFNPSILSTEEGWLINVRSSNYKIRNWGYIMPPADGGHVRTENILARYDHQFQLIGSQQLKTEYIRSGFFAEGLEDVRLNLVNGELIGSATLRDVAGWNGDCRISAFKIDDVVQPTLLPSPSTQAEKNWMPLLGRRQWLYSSYHEGHVALVYEDNGSWIVEKKAAAPILAKGFRGGSQLVPTGNGKWLCVIHEVAINGGHRVYEHRFVEFDEYAGWAISAVSPPFTLKVKISIEFVAGLALKGDRLILTFGEMDEFAWLAEVSLTQVRQILASPA